jgi:glutamyl-tRNA reductase
MSFLVVGLSHHTAPLSLLEQASIGATDIPKTLHELVVSPYVAEALLVSTCNRIEVYADVERFHGSLQDVTGVLARNAGVELNRLAEFLYVHYEDAAVEHLFTVAAGLDSMVLGESQIVGQLRLAYQTAIEEDSVGRALHDVVQRALRLGKRVRTETGIDRAGASLVSHGLTAIEATLGSLAGRSALVVGAGSMGALAVATLRRSGVDRIAVANRTLANAQRLAATTDASTPGTAGTLDDLPELLVDADLVVAATGAAGVVVDYDLVADAVARRAGRPLAVLDLGLPRDADPDVARLPGVTYVDIKVLGERLAGSGRAADVEAARRIVAEEVGAHLAALRAGLVAPTVTALRARASELVAAELARLHQRLPELDARAREELDRTVHRVANRLLHAPTVRVKQLAEAPGGDVYAAALRELFELDPAAAEAVSTPSVALPETYEDGDML